MGYLGCRSIEELQNKPKFVQITPAGLQESHVHDVIITERKPPITGWSKRMEYDLYTQKILILDFGSQYTQLIARRVREARVYCEIHPFNMDFGAITNFAPKGHYFFPEGLPASISRTAPFADRRIFELNVPVLGICYGMQYMTSLLDGVVGKSNDREYGHAMITIVDDSDLLYGLGKGEEKTVWMSRGDRIDRMPRGFSVLAGSANSPVAAMADQTRKWFGGPVSSGGRPYAGRKRRYWGIFCSGSAGVNRHGIWPRFIQRTIKALRERVGTDRVICGLSGGVDSPIGNGRFAAQGHWRQSVVHPGGRSGLLRKDEARDSQFVLGLANRFFPILPRHFFRILVIDSMGNGKFNGAPIVIIKDNYTDCFEVCLHRMVEQNEYTVNPLAVVCVVFHRVVYTVIATL